MKEGIIIGQNTISVQLEFTVEEYDRVHGIFEIAVEQSLDIPESVWKVYIDTEIQLNEIDRAKKPYDRLLEKSKHVKIWSNYAEFERIIIVDFWLKFEMSTGNK